MSRRRDLQPRLDLVLHGNHVERVNRRPGADQRGARAGELELRLAHLHAGLLRSLQERVRLVMRRRKGVDQAAHRAGHLATWVCRGMASGADRSLVKPEQLITGSCDVVVVVARRAPGHAQHREGPRMPALSEEICHHAVTLPANVPDP